MSAPSRNSFLHGSLAVLFARTALPIIFVMVMNGFLTVADALFLGHFVGPDALAAVTLIFPLYMLIFAFSTLVANGMSSLLALDLGGSRIEAARTTYASAYWLAIAAGLVLSALYLLFGDRMTLLAAGGDVPLAEMAGTYLKIIVFTSPLMFAVSVDATALRNEGHVGTIAVMSLLVSLSNVGFNYVLIALLQMGVAGSAWGTVLAQLLALGLLFAFRFGRNTILRPDVVVRHIAVGPWSRMLALGAPQSLNFIGVALASSAILAALQIARSPDYAATVSAYGIITRITTFAFLPLLGLAQAMQTITGNNHGAGLWQRSGISFRIAVLAALVFCIGAEAAMVLFAPQIGGLFIADPYVIAQVGAIMPVMVACYALSGPLMMVAMHFQAIGDAGRAAILGLSKPYLFTIPMVFALALLFGDEAIWWAGPAAELLLLGLTTIVLIDNARRQSLRWGLFGPPAARA